MIEFNNATPLYEEINPDTIEQELERVQECISALDSKVTLGPASTFSSNIQAMYSLLDMPHIVSVYSQGYAAASTVRFAKEYLADKSLFGEDLEEAFESKLERDDTDIYNLIPWLISQQDGVREALEYQLAFVVVALWTTLESLSRDVWTEAVNSCPQPLAQYTLEAQTESAKGNDPRSIKASWLAKYGFDLRNCMGTVLTEDEAKFRFSSPDQIVKAYKAVFKDNKEVNQMWGTIKKDLSMLNLTRNLVAHRAGIVDDRFNRQAKLDLPLGKRLPLNTQNVHQFVSVAVRAGCELLALCDTTLLRYSPQGGNAAS